jgi:hypothetical protein
MLPKTRKTRKYRRSGKSLIAAGFLNPQRWHNLSKGEIARALRENQGLSVKEVNDSASVPTLSRRRGREGKRGLERSGKRQLILRFVLIFNILF